MGEIAQLLQERVGLNDSQAQEAENAVIQFVKSKVPEQFQGTLDTFLGSSQNASAEPAASTSGSQDLGSLLGEAETLLGRRS